MERYVSDCGKECYRGVTKESKFSVDLFSNVTSIPDNDDIQVALHTNIGSITVLDRLTGYSGCVRDTETGFRDMNGQFWLASGMCDVRESGAHTFEEAINWIKSNANTCVPDNKC